MAARKTYVVKKALNLRTEPSKNSDIIAVLPEGLRITVKTDRKAPDGWVAVDSVGYVMLEFLE